jgi:hypothetical protein
MRVTGVGADTRAAAIARLVERVESSAADAADRTQRSDRRGARRGRDCGLRLVDDRTRASAVTALPCSWLHVHALAPRRRSHDRGSGGWRGDSHAWRALQAIDGLTDIVLDRQAP